MSDHESRGSEGASSGGEEQTPTPQDDAVNPSQRPESLQPEDEQRSTIVEHIEKPENAEEVEPNSHLPPKDPPERAKGPALRTAPTGLAKSRPRYETKLQLDS